MNNADQIAIVDLLNFYALALDARQWHLFDAIFTKDVTADFGPAGASWTGLDNFTQAFSQFHATLDRHQHTMMGPVVRVEGDTAHAFTYGTWLLVREAADGGSYWLGNGWYDDELVRTEGGWRIHSRRCRLLSWSGNPAVAQPVGDQHPDMNTNAVHHFADANDIGLLAHLTTS